MARTLPTPTLRRIRPLLGLLYALIAVPALATTIYYPRPVSRDDPRYDYPVQLLELALEKSGSQYDLKYASLVMTQDRALLEIAARDGKVDIMATMTTKEREEKMLAVRIPIDKGLIGWRIPLVKAGHGELFKSIHDVEDLRRLRCGQGHDWPDTDILRSNGVPVYAASDYEALFSMVAAGRVDHFPRSLVEVWPEAAVHRALAVDRYIVIRYPSAFYYFVNRHNSQLAEAVQRGLEVAIADGSFERLFNRHFADAIRKAQLDKRHIIDLNNPLLPDGLPAEHKELWFTLDEARRMSGGGKH